jgi:hypothetical protein
VGSGDTFLTDAISSSTLSNDAMIIISYFLDEYDIFQSALLLRHMPLAL